MSVISRRVYLHSEDAEIFCGRDMTTHQDVNIGG